VEQVSQLLKSYNLARVVGDRYSAGWVVEAFAKHGIRYVHSDRDRSAVYADCLPLFTSGRAHILDHKRLISQFASLERRVTPRGRDKIDARGHEDCTNAAAIAMTLASVVKKDMVFTVPFLVSQTSHARAFDGDRVTHHTIDAVAEPPQPGQPITQPGESPEAELERLIDAWNNPEKRPADLCGPAGTNRLLMRIRGLERELKREPAELPANPGAPQWSGKYHDPSCGHVEEKPGGWPARTETRNRSQRREDAGAQRRKTHDARCSAGSPQPDCRHRGATDRTYRRA
jgi:hypothetical protein